MKIINKHIAVKAEAFLNHPHIQYLQSSDDGSHEKVKIFPYICHWVMSFGDINKYLLKKADADSDAIEKIINDHADEDAEHWQWFIEDMEKLQTNAASANALSPSVIWSADTRSQRMLTYKLSHYFMAESSRIRYAIIEFVEEMGRIAFVALCEVAAKYEADTGVSLKYFGHHHLEKETGHVVNTDEEKVSLLSAIELTEAEVARSIAIIDDLYGCFSGMTDELEIIRKKLAV
jgi:hypothetical protein